MKVLLLETMWSAEIFSFFFWNFDTGNLLDWKFEILVGIVKCTDRKKKKQITKTLILSSKTTCNLGAVYMEGGRSAISQKVEQLQLFCM